MNAKQIYYLVLAALGAIGTWIANVLGGWDAAMGTLFIFMGIDLLTGFLLAAVFHASPKSKGGALESKAMAKGLVRKGMAMLVVLIANRLDLMLGLDYIRNGVIIAFCVNELLSIIENMGLMGVPMPEILTNAVELLRRKGEKPKE